MSVAALRISRRATERLRSGHVWVYRSDLLADPAQADASPAPGALVTVEDPAGRPLGSALYSSASQIALRLVSREGGQNRSDYLAGVRTRIRAALERRRLAAPLSGDPENVTTAQRLLFSEADDLPGIVADRYGELVVLQLLIQGTAQADVRSTVASALDEAHREGSFVDAASLTVWERADARIRMLEQLAEPPAEPLLYRQSAGAGEARSPATATRFSLNGLRFGYDLAAGQKTGAFLDQRLNYLAAAEWIRRSGRTRHALDVCTYQGGFALHLAQVCEQVAGVDQSRAALEVAEQNREANPSLTAAVNWIEADAFALLRTLDSEEKGPATRRALQLPARFDAVVLDPPAFAKSQRAVEGALRGYKELNLRAMRLLEPGGTLVTCSCSHHVSLPAFTEAVSAAAADAGRRVQLLESRAAAPDHPEILTLPETRYLKCLICRVE